MVLALVLALFLAGYTELRRRQIQRRNPPAGILLQVDGAQVHVIEDGGQADPGAPVVLFVHGASGNGQDLRLAFSGLLPEAVRCVYIDRPGLGHSDRRLPADAAPRDQARRLLATMTALGHEVFTVVGHSFGAAVAAAMALEAPARVQALVFLAPATHPWNGKVAWYYRLSALPVIGWLFCRVIALPVAERVAPLSMRHVFAPDPVPPAYDARIGLELLFRPESFRSNACDLAAFNRHLADQARLYPRIGQPAVIVTGDQDGVVWPSIHSRGLKRDLPAARLIELPGAGHMPQHAHAAEIAAHILTLADGTRALQPAGGEPAPGAGRPS
ncbi:alpha/beta fold hydrolase [Microvirga tunisiensis]|uniref:Alpha/beta fold hydrolase n=1 Tax=Pannonibacter tanglangensis TaxID=2750084 RepID=A0A7X5JAS8_9HYPH|nr:alpha/beta fold hydrolase [Pannonibacter sp. XCT-53]